MLWCFRIVAAIVLGLFAAHRGQTAIAQQSHPTESTTWHQIALGAGGLLTGIDIAPDGTMVVKTDTFGAYIWNSKTTRWDQLITASSWGRMQITRRLWRLGNQNCAEPDEQALHDLEWIYLS